MVGGKIVDYYETQNVVRFLVKDNKYKEYCTVRAALPDAAKNEIKLGDPIWWQAGSVFLQLFGEEDVPFNKVGNSGGSAKNFYAEKAVKQPVASLE